MSFDFDQATKEKRDRDLRGSILTTLNHARQEMRGLRARTMMTVVGSKIVDELSFENDSHAMGLISDLVNKGLITSKQSPRPDRTRVTPDRLTLHITDKGSMLCRWNIPADPDINDGRAVDE